MSDGINPGSLEDQVEIGNPSQPHCPTVLLLDTSGSMAEAQKIDDLNAGLIAFQEDVLQDDLARKRLDVALVTFGSGVNYLHVFSGMEEFCPPVLTASGQTPMAEGIETALNLVEERKQQYRTQGIDHFRPWVIMITDGEPTDMRSGDAKWLEIKERLRSGEKKAKFTFFAIVAEPGNLEMLKDLCPARPPMRLKGGRFKEFFLWLSNSTKRVSSSKVGEQVSLPSPSTWANITA